MAAIAIPSVPQAHADAGGKPDEGHGNIISK